MNEQRTVDRIETGPIFNDEQAIRLNRMFRGSSTREMLTSVIKDELVGNLTTVSSLHSSLHSWA